MADVLAPSAEEPDPDLPGATILVMPQPRNSTDSGLFQSYSKLFKPIQTKKINGPQSRIRNYQAKLTTKTKIPFLSWFRKQSEVSNHLDSFNHSDTLWPPNSGELMLWQN
jgi:hypothetical protein